MEKYIDLMADDVMNNFKKAIEGESKLDCSYKSGIMKISGKGDAVTTYLIFAAIISNQFKQSLSSGDLNNIGKNNIEKEMLFLSSALDIIRDIYIANMANDMIEGFIKGKSKSELEVLIKALTSQRKDSDWMKKMKEEMDNLNK